MDWNDLRFALAISRTGSLSGASRALRVHQTTVGRRLSALEEALGFPLFIRTVSGLAPTADGARVLASIDTLAASLTRFEQSVRGELTGVQGLVRIAVTETGARQLVEGALPLLVREHPGLSIELVPTNAVVDLARGDADLAVRLTKPDDSLIARKLGVVRYGLYAGAKRRDELTDVVMPSRELAKGPEATWLRENARAARVVLHASSLVTAAIAVAQGLGMCVLPDNLAAMHRVRLVRALPEIAPRPVYLVMHPEQRRLARVRVVATAVAQEIKKRLSAS